MPLSSRGRLLLAAGLACFPLALIARSLVPAFLGTVLVALALDPASPRGFFRTTRAVPAQAQVGVPFETTLRVDGPDGHPITFQDEIPPTLRTLEIGTGRGIGRAETRSLLVGEAPGTATWGEIHVRLQEPLGLWESMIALPSRSVLAILPAAGAAEHGRSYGRRLQADSRTAIAKDGDAIEYDGLHEYRPGDRFRDIDWAHSLSLGSLVAREIKRHAHMPLIIHLDAGRTMLSGRRRLKFTSGVNAALSVAAAAEAAGMSSGLVVWSENGVDLRLASIKGPRAMTLCLRELAGRTLRDRHTPPAADQPAQPLTRTERDFLVASGQFQTKGTGSRTPVEASLDAVAAITGQPAVVVVLLDVEERPHTLTPLLRRLRLKQCKPIVVGFASGAHHYSRESIDAYALADLAQWRRNREVGRAICERHRVPFAVVGPHAKLGELVEVVGSAL